MSKTAGGAGRWLRGWGERKGGWERLTGWELDRETGGGAKEGGERERNEAREYRDGEGQRSLKTSVSQKTV